MGVTLAQSEEVKLLDKQISTLPDGLTNS